MARTRYKIFENQQPYYLTCTIVNWLPIFGNPEIVQIVLDSLRFLQEHKRLTIFAYIIMEHHLHLVASSKNLT
ncbi:MAG: transposase, partial [Candidatus Cloacimonetes bacterium]|nr:transposase [Candidatus Cloacimonadota bacterium]